MSDPVRGFIVWNPHPAGEGLQAAWRIGRFGCRAPDGGANIGGAKAGLNRPHALQFTLYVPVGFAAVTGAQVGVNGKQLSRCRHRGPERS